MDTRLVNEKSIPTFDAHLLQRMGSSARIDDEDVMRLAIRNTEGQIYRTVDLKGLASWLFATSVLTEMGLQDELEDRDPVDGYDAIFSPPPGRMPLMR